MSSTDADDTAAAAAAAAAASAAAAATDATTTTTTSATSSTTPTSTSAATPTYRAEAGKTLTIYGADGRRHTYDDQGRELGNDPSTGYYEEVEIEDMEYVEAERTYYYPCPCGDRFRITVDQLIDGDDIATCPSCSLVIKVIYDPEEFFESEEDSDVD